MPFNKISDAIAAIQADYRARPDSAAACQLGDLMIVKPDGAPPTSNLLWIMGFNGGETSKVVNIDGHTPSALRWFHICRQAAEAIGSPAWIIGERTHWGSPTVKDLVLRTGSQERFRALLRLHSEANKALLRNYRPRVVWMTGLSTYSKEASEDYNLVSVGIPAERDKRGRLWQEYISEDGVPWLATIHPTGARMSGQEFQRVREKLKDISTRF